MKLALLSLVFAFGSIPLSAQNAATQRFKVPGTEGFGVAGIAGLGSAASYRVQVSQGCPVAMRLNQKFNSAVRQVGKDPKRLDPAANLHLEISSAPNSNAKAAAVKAAMVTIQGYDRSPRLELISPSPSLPVRTMHIQFAPVAGNGASADFAVSGIVSVSRLQIDSLTFANGATWRPARGESCIVTPDPFMLVGTR
jgi:hypothetical protein